jgi:hypothetical protein
MKLSMSARQRSLAQPNGWTVSVGNREWRRSSLRGAAKRFDASVKLRSALSKEQ